MQDYSQRNVYRILQEKEMLSKKLEYRMKDLETWSKELDKKQALTELERQKLEEEKKKVTIVYTYALFTRVNDCLFVLSCCYRTMPRTPLSS